MSAPDSSRQIVDEFATRLAAAVEAMAGKKPAVTWDPLPAAPADPDAMRWRQPLAPLPGAVWLIAAEAAWSVAGHAILQGAGIDDAAPAEWKSTYAEAANQALAGLAQAMTSWLGREVTPKDGAETAAAPATEAEWAEVHVKVGEDAFSLVLGLEAPLITAAVQESRASRAAESGPPATTAPAPPDPPSKTFDLLLDVELPVSVSFGRAQIPLKELIKLTTGSIVELNRAIAEPVEIIVNNCVIARGEVVVVDGNFGARIQEVISRQERLRTLQ